MKYRKNKIGYLVKPVDFIGVPASVEDADVNTGIKKKDLLGRQNLYLNAGLPAEAWSVRETKIGLPCEVESKAWWSQPRHMAVLHCLILITEVFSAIRTRITDVRRRVRAYST
jgi:hypothetical protein